MNKFYCFIILLVWLVINFILGISLIGVVALVMFDETLWWNIPKWCMKELSFKKE